MRKKMKVFIMVTVVAIAAVWFAGSDHWTGLLMKYQIEQKMLRLFCKTDHQALLEACRELSKRVVSGELQPGSYRIGRLPGRRAPHFPETICALRPREVIVSEDATVRLSMYSGWRPFGVWACPEGYEGARPETARRKLLDGLWYYDDEYRHYGDAVDKAIDALIKAHCQGGQGGGNQGIRRRTIV